MCSVRGRQQHAGHLRQRLHRAPMRQLRTHLHLTAPQQAEIDEGYRRGDAHLSPAWFVDGREAIASRLRARRDAGLVHSHAAGGALLEIGPGRGTFLRAARRRGFDVFGVELNPTQASFIRSERDPLRGVAGGGAGAAGGQFDVIYHRDVLSHFYDPHEEMERLRALLKPGGFHIFETGNLADVDHRYLKLIRPFSTRTTSSSMASAACASCSTRPAMHTCTLIAGRCCPSGDCAGALIGRAACCPVRGDELRPTRAQRRSRRVPIRRARIPEAGARAPGARPPRLRDAAKRRAIPVRRQGSADADRGRP